jgi:hypothetical protein
MLNFRQFEAGPDPFGRAYCVQFKWMQTAIALRHSDTVDVKFILESGGCRSEKTVALPHAALVELAGRMQRPLADAWCSRLAAAHLLHLVATGEDLEKDLVTAAPDRLEVYAAELEREEREEIRKRDSGR